MKALYFECNMGAAGDMLMAALLELHPEPESFLKRLNGAGIPGVNVTAHTSKKCGIKGSMVRVAVNGEEEGHHHGEHEHVHDEDHHHGEHEHVHQNNGYRAIEEIINELEVEQIVKQDALQIYKLIAQAESAVHGVSVSDIHFHELGTYDAVADIIGVCMLISELKPQVIYASPLNTGRGQVSCAHGILPVPAPATAVLLKGIPIFCDDTDGELLTPTGAAILKHFAHRFCSMPLMQAERIGYGMGKKDFAKANCVRAFLGEINDEQITELSCNLDDITAEELAFAREILFESGALDVYTTAICMKKNRAGVMLTVLCRPEMANELKLLMFKHTTTLGIRAQNLSRTFLQRSTEKRNTRYGDINVKHAQGFNLTKTKPEYDDVAAIAKKLGLSLREVTDALR